MSKVNSVCGFCGKIFFKGKNGTGKFCKHKCWTDFQKLGKSKKRHFFEPKTKKVNLGVAVDEALAANNNWAFRKGDKATISFNSFVNPETKKRLNELSVLYKAKVKELESKHKV